MSQELIEIVRDEFPETIQDSHTRHGNDTVVVETSAVPSILEFLKENPETDMDLLRNISCVDYDNRVPRFEVAYILYSIDHKHMLIIRTRVKEDDASVPTVSHLYRCAQWIERETYDMYGIEFTDHPDLRRVLLYEEFDGYPLRKDYPKQKGQPRTEFIARERDSVEEFNSYVKGEPADGSRDY
jgi:NADH-quinone oxidoreductase subunit C